MMEDRGASGWVIVIVSILVILLIVAATLPIVTSELSEGAPLTVFMRPDRDQTVPGDWTSTDPDFYTAIDETMPDDAASYIELDCVTSCPNGLFLGWEDLPVVPGDILSATFRVRGRLVMDDAGVTEEVLVTVEDGGTASMVIDLTGAAAWTTFEQDVTAELNAFSFTFSVDMTILQQDTTATEYIVQITWTEVELSVPGPSSIPATLQPLFDLIPLVLAAGAFLIVFTVVWGSRIGGGI